MKGAVLINAGSGETADAMLNELNVLVTDVLLTHYFRDVSAGAAKIIRKTGAKLHVPFYERSYFEDAEQHWRERATFSLFDTRQDRFGPTQSIKVSESLYDFQTLNMPGLEFRVIPTPAVTPGATTLPIRPTSIGSLSVASASTRLTSAPNAFPPGPLR